MLLRVVAEIASTICDDSADSSRDCSCRAKIRPATRVAALGSLYLFCALAMPSRCDELNGLPPKLGSIGVYARSSAEAVWLKRNS